MTLTHRRIDNEPKLIIEFDNQNGDIVTAKLINDGKIAKILKIEENKSNDFIIDFPFNYIGEGKEKEIYFRYKNVHERNENTTLDFKIIYEDIDKKIHTKYFKYKDLESIINEKYKNQMSG